MSREERWQLSGNAAEFYERYVGLLMEPWVYCFLDVAALQPTEHVLDVACGTGWRTADAGALPFENGIFDVVLCQQGVQCVSDRLHALREMRRVLRVGGRLAFTVWSAIGDTSYHAALTDALARYLSAEAGSMARVP